MDSLLSRFPSPQVIVGRTDALILNPTGILTHRYLSSTPEKPSLPTNVKPDLPITWMTQIGTAIYFITCDGQLSLIRTYNRFLEAIHLDTPVIQVFGSERSSYTYCLTADGSVYLIQGLTQGITDPYHHHYYDNSPLVKLDLPALDIAVGNWEVVILLQDRSLVALKRSVIGEVRVEALPLLDSMTASRLTFHESNLIVTVKQPGNLVMYRRLESSPSYPRRGQDPVIVKTPHPVSQVVPDGQHVLLISVEGHLHSFYYRRVWNEYDVIQLPFRVADVFLGPDGHRVYVTENGRIYWSEGEGRLLPL